MTYRIISSLHFACSRTIVPCIETFILCKTVLFCRKILKVLRFGRTHLQMKFNVAQRHSMRVTRHYSHNQNLHDYTLQQQTYPQSKIYWHRNHMDWGQHISDISSKATKILGFLRRNLAFAPMSTKEVAYKTLVRLKLEYAV